MNRIALIAAVIGLGAAPAFAATQSNNAQPANPPAQQQQPLKQHQAQLDRQQQNIDKQQAKLDQQQLNQQGQQHAQKNANAAENANAQDRNVAANRQGWSGNGQAGTQSRAHRVDLRANRATKALNMLEANGYTNFTNFHRVRPGVFTASVDRHGRWMSVRIDPLDNQIMRG